MTISIDPSIYTGSPADTAGRSPSQIKTYEFLDSLGIEYFRADHQSADTIEACHQVEKHLDVKICKNLFLANRQSSAFYLLLMPADKVFRTKNLSKILGTNRLSFAAPEYMEKHLGLHPGSASVMGLINDAEGMVNLVIDRPVIEEEYIGCHPCESSSTLKIKVSDLMERILPALGRKPIIIDLPEED